MNKSGLGMKTPRFNRSYLSELIILVIAALCIAVVALIHRDPGFIKYSPAVTPFYIFQPDQVTEEVIPDYAGIERTYTLTIPETDSVTTTGSRLTFFLRHTIARFYIEGSSLDNDLSEEDSPHISHTPGNYWVSIPLKPAYAGKTVKIILTPVFENVRDETPEFMAITRDMQLYMLELPKDLPLLALSITAILSGFFLAVFSLFLPLALTDKRRLVCLGAATAAAGLWKACGLPAVLLALDFLGLQKEIWFTGALSYLLMLVLSLMLLVSLREDKADQTGIICFYVGAASSAVIVLLQAAGVLEIHDILIFYGIGMALLHLISLFSRKPSKTELLWLLPFFLTLGADLLVYQRTGTMRSAPLFLIWIIVNLFIRGYGFVREALMRERVLAGKEEELRTARTQAMINQIRPHFIYNTLVSVYVLMKDDPEKAGEVINDFTNYLQSNFNAITASDPVSFGDELRHTQSYLAVESVLYGDKLKVEYDTEFIAFRIPPLTLQPIVENAVKYGVAKGYYPEHIVIRTRAGKDSVIITVEDDGPGFSDEETGAGIGLNNVRERLYMMCRGTLEVSSHPEGGTSVIVTIPFDN